MWKEILALLGKSRGSAGLLSTGVSQVELGSRSRLRAIECKNVSKHSVEPRMLSEDRLDGNDHCRVQLWLDRPCELRC
jgi:hypothetical protein